MALTYQWTLTSIKKTNGANLSNVIIGTNWVLTGTDENGVSGEFHGATPFSIDNVDPQTFTAYENLTANTVLGWIQSVVVGDYKDHIDAQIIKQINSKINPIDVVTDFPWSS